MERITRIIVIGGFLGAGKTTLIRRLAQHYLAAGHRVGVVTNDQAHGLVDTQTFRHEGLPVVEVPGACFCCKFHELVGVAEQLRNQAQPDIILAEPVGSCTDLQATVIEPLRHLHRDRYELAPFVVLLKPEHGARILAGKPQSGFSPKAAYIFFKQLEEADVVVINKVDKLSAEQVRELRDLLEARVNAAKVLAISARTGQGCDELVRLLEQPAVARERRIEVDYDVYAEGEAELGWLNAQIGIDAAQKVPLDRLVWAFGEKLRRELSAAGVEPAHLKLYAEHGPDAAVVNWVSADEPVELSVASEAEVKDVELFVNARVVADPQLLEETLRRVLDEVAREWALSTELRALERFRPARPVPTYRWS
ncbi:MAG: hypothetical protein KatS3mg109_1400 [Pirellulaceae bacterium]|nr:MAG: hypothetical protein KatS3mg109_1400 [Pirellulaceae bacterium]